ncbi:hypothetical protein MHU86_18666 [Fragilaria crotonensis]|nr:hypothetical protein MHU86_18666 [Fragilaria crotonensis]
MKLTLIALQVLAVSAFTSPSVINRHVAPLSMSAVVDNDAPITVTGNNIDLTPALVDYINKKLERPLESFALMKHQGLFCPPHRQQESKGKECASY